MTRTTSVAMTAATHSRLADHLLRDDGQEDICMALYAPSTGATRTTAVLVEPVLPVAGDREVHGNATITSQYVLRVAALARERSLGVAILHSHPGGRVWQPMSKPDRHAEKAFANLARELTGRPLVGLTLGGADHGWSARHWDRGVGRNIEETPSDNVRVVGDTLTITWNDTKVPPPAGNSRLVRTVSAWGDRAQADLARRRVLVVGAGSVGLDLILRLAASGVTRITTMDFDVVELCNLDRLIGAGIIDVLLRRAKVYVAAREALRAATADLQIRTYRLSICEPDALSIALDHDLILSAVDRPWARAVLNTIAYSDLVPVIDGGIAIDRLSHGGMRNATWRSHVLRPGRPCMQCTRQIDGARVSADIQGLLDDPTYLAGLPERERERARSSGANVAPLSINVAAAMLAQYVSFSVAPGGIGDPGPLQYSLSTHHLGRVPFASTTSCSYEAQEGLGDARTDLTGEHSAATEARRGGDSPSLLIRAALAGARLVDAVRVRARQRASKFVAARY